MGNDGDITNQDNSNNTQYQYNTDSINNQNEFTGSGCNESINEQHTNEQLQQQEPISKKKSFKEFIKSFVLTVIQFVVIVGIINLLVLNAKVPTGSMEGTINPNDRLIANKVAYIFSEPERYDVVVFKYPDDENVLFVKRIIGLPGETIEIRNGNIYVDNNIQPVKDSFIKEPMAEGNWGPYEVPEDSYFMLGDNRNNSMDSRFWDNKYVSSEKILGKVICTYYPHISLVE